MLNPISLRFLAISLILPLVQGVQLGGAQAQFDPEVYYELSTEFRGPNMKLDVINGGAKDKLTRLTAGQFIGHGWQLGKPYSDGYFKIGNRFNGNGFCLDVGNGGAIDNQPQIRRCGDFTGQLWKVTAFGPYYQFKTKFRGDTFCLDIFSDGLNVNQPHLAPCDTGLSGQRWKVTKTDLSTAVTNERLLTVQRTVLYGGTGGRPFEISCPFGAILTGIEARHGAWVDAIRPVCSFYLRNVPTTAETPRPQPSAGGNGGSSGYIRCSTPFGVITSMRLHQSRNDARTIAHITVECGDYRNPSQFSNKAGGSNDYLGTAQAGVGMTVKCPPPLVAGGLFGRSGNAVDALGLVCVNYQPR